jgi:hypothetical protein
VEHVALRVGVKKLRLSNEAPCGKTTGYSAKENKTDRKIKNFNCIGNYIDLFNLKFNPALAG